MSPDERARPRELAEAATADPDGRFSTNAVRAFEDGVGPHHVLSLLGALATAEAERDAALREAELIREQHARILSWRPVDVGRAKTVILAHAAALARSGKDGTQIRDAVDALDKALSQEREQVDAMRAERDAARGLLVHCAHCEPGTPATCIGAYEGAAEEEPACDECCAHGNEDGHCWPAREWVAKRSGAAAVLDAGRDWLRSTGTPDCDRGYRNGCAQVDAVRALYCRPCDAQARLQEALRAALGDGGGS